MSDAAFLAVVTLVLAGSWLALAWWEEWRRFDARNDALIEAMRQHPAGGREDAA